MNSSPERKGRVAGFSSSGDPTAADIETLIKRLTRLAGTESVPNRSANASAAGQMGLAETRYRTLVEQIPAVTFLASMEEGSPELYVSPQIERLLGFTQKEWLGNPFLWYHRLHPEDRERWQQEFARSCATGVDLRSDYRFLAHDGQIVWIHAECQLVRDPSGRPLFLQGIAFDITEQKRAEELKTRLHDKLERQVWEHTNELRHSNEALEAEVAERRRVETVMRDSQLRLQTILDTAVDAVIVIDAHGIIRQCNPSVTRLLGYTPEDLLGQNVSLIMPAPYREEHDHYLTTYLATGNKRVIGKGREVTARHKNGRVLPVELAVGEVRLANEHLFTGFLRDLSDRKRLEEQVRRSQKLDAVGQLASGVAHEFNNLLTVINGYTDALLDRLPAEDLRRVMVYEVRKAGTRAAQLTQHLLAFSQRQVNSPALGDLNALLQKAEPTLRQLLDADVNLTLALEATSAQARIDPEQLEQILISLVSNSRDALPGRGTVTVRTWNAPALPGEREEQQSRWVVLSVTDTGCGMDERIQGRIFEPFFTTKEVDKGTGLGLAVVYGIVRAWSGHIHVTSAPGRGTTLDIYLPGADSSAANRPSDGDRTNPCRGDETVLLVEDEAEVRAVSCLSLQKLGYKVLEAKGGPEALEIGGRYSGTIHLLVTDIVMPRMNGRQLSDALRMVRPKLRVLYLSGSPGDSLVVRGIPANATNVLEKPYSLAALRKKVRAVLDESSP